MKSELVLMNNNCMSLFATPIYKVNLSNESETAEALHRKLEAIFSEQHGVPQHPLETGAALSTWGDQTLAGSDEIKKLASIVLFHARIYWEQLGYEPAKILKIARCWANYHDETGMTLEHNHGAVHINAVFYLKLPVGSGDLLLRNPLEYHLATSPFAAPYADRLWEKAHVQSGDLVLMPGWLKHRTEKSMSKERRINISFNINGWNS